MMREREHGASLSRLYRLTDLTGTGTGKDTSGGTCRQEAAVSAIMATQAATDVTGKSIV